MDDFCLTFTDSRSSINKSWICLKNNVDDCFFLRQQQFDRSSYYCGSVEALTIIFLSLTCYPANVAAVRTLAKLQVKREFFFLATIIAFCNICLASIGILQGISRSTNDWLFGIVGCAATIPGPEFFTTLKLWTHTAISFERCLSISQKSHSLIHHRNNSNNSTSSRNSNGSCSSSNSKNANNASTSRFGSFLSVIILLLILNCSLWIYPFSYIEVLQIMLPRTSSSNNEIAHHHHQRPVNVCALMAFKMPANESLVKCMFTIATFCIPLILNFANYLRIWMIVSNVKRLSRARSQKPSNESQSLSMNTRALTLLLPFSNKNNDTVNGNYYYKRFRCYRQEVHLAGWTLLSLVEFVIFSLPSQIADGYIRYDNNPNRRVMQSSVLFVTHCLLLVNAISNPLIECLLVSRRSTIKKRKLLSPSSSLLIRNRHYEKQGLSSCHRQNQDESTLYLNYKQQPQENEPIYEGLISTQYSDYCNNSSEITTVTTTNILASPSSP